MTKSALESNETDLLLARMRSRFIAYPAYTDLQVKFDSLLSKRRTEIELGLRGEAQGIAVIGASGSGKSTIVERLLSRHPSLQRPDQSDEIAETVELLIPSPATLKHVGLTMLTALGYPLKRDRPAAYIWDQVRHFLKLRKTLFIHLDEAQDLYGATRAMRQDSAVNTLKTLMNQKDWPVGLILSGTPDLAQLINSDVQLMRRLYVVILPAVSWATHPKEITIIFQGYLAEAGLEADGDLDLKDFLPRLIHAGMNQFGIILNLLLDGVEEALRAKACTVTIRHYAQAYRRKASCPPGLNPFLAADWRAIDPSRIHDLSPEGDDI